MPLSSHCADHIHTRAGAREGEHEHTHTHTHIHTRIQRRSAHTYPGERLLATVGIIGLLRETEQNYQLMFYGKKFAQSMKVYEALKKGY